MITIRVWVDGLGMTHAIPTDINWVHKFSAHLRQFHTEPRITSGELASAFFQDSQDMPEELTNHEEWPEAVKGWTFEMEVDPWVFGHWLGWDAHTVAEEEVE